MGVRGSSGELGGGPAPGPSGRRASMYTGAGPQRQRMLSVAVGGRPRGGSRGSRGGGEPGKDPGCAAPPQIETFGQPLNNRWATCCRIWITRDPSGTLLGHSFGLCRHHSGPYRDSFWPLFSCPVTFIHPKCPGSICLPWIPLAAPLYSHLFSFSSNPAHPRVFLGVPQLSGFTFPKSHRGL